MSLVVPDTQGILVLRTIYWTWLDMYVKKKKLLKAFLTSCFSYVTRYKGLSPLNRGSCDKSPDTLLTHRQDMCGSNERGEPTRTVSKFVLLPHKLI